MAILAFFNIGRQETLVLPPKNHPRRDDEIKDKTDLPHGSIIILNVKELYLKKGELCRHTLL